MAIEAYKKAISAYRVVSEKFPDSEYAPEALYVVAASHMYISELLQDSERQAELFKMGAAYRELAEKYPQSEHAAKAFLSVGNDYYNQASQPEVSIEDRANLYRQSLENYRQALQVPGIADKTRMDVESYIRDTEGLLANDIYNMGAVLIPLPNTDEEMKKAKEAAPDAIPYFNEVIEKFPNTDYADLSYVQLGLCYEYMEDWENAEKSYGAFINKYTDPNGNPIAPFSQNVVQALAFARQRKGKIMIYRLSIIAREQSRD